MDIWGHFKLETYDQKMYFVNVVDDYSKMTWVLLMALKSNACVIIKHFVLYAKNQFDLRIKSIRTDNGKEFVNKDLELLVANRWIVHHLT